MPRIPAIEPASATGKAKELFDGPLKPLQLNIFKSMVNSPATVQAYLGLSGGVAHGTLTPVERELIQLTAGQANNCEYCVAAHTFLGTKAGLTQDQTVEARRGTVKDAKLNGLAKFVLALHEKRGMVSDQDVSAFKAAGYNDGQIAEVVANYALATFTNYFNHVNQTVVDLPPAPKI